jgi:hypothetical protein
MAALVALTVPSQAQPRVSPAAQIEQTVGLTEIAITYSRPSVREREVFGELEPYGKVWRTGANEASTFSTSTDINVEGKPLAAGTYALFTIPGKDSWTVIFNKEAKQWGAFKYEEEKDALRIKVKPQAAKHQEQFQISFSQVDLGSATVLLHWQETQVPFQIKVNTIKQAYHKAQEDIEEAKTSGNGRAIWNWANYFYQQDAYVEEALGWAKIVSIASPKLYWSWSLQARLENKAGQNAAALVSAKKAMQAAKEQAESPGVAQDSKLLGEEMASWAK